MTGPAVGTDPELTDALRRALAANSAEEYVDTPSALRTRLVAETGERATELRGQIHLLVAAADERLPHALAAAAPVDRPQLDRIAQSLSSTRGWSVEAAQGVVLAWADAMDVLASGTTEREGSTGDRGDHGAAGRQNGVGRLEGDVGAGPTRLPLAGLLVSSAPSEGRAALAAAPPESDAAVATPAAPATPATPAARRMPPAGADPAPWPGSKQRDLELAAQRESHPPAGVYRAFHPRSPVVQLGVSAAVLALGVLVFVLTHVLVGALPLILIVLVTRRLVPEGRLVVDETGGRFYRKLKDATPPQVTFTWAQAHVRSGLAARIDSPAGTIWCGLFNTAVPAAARSRANVSDGDHHVG